MPIPSDIRSLLNDVKFWADIISEHAQILLSVLPRLRPIYAQQLLSFQRRFADLVHRIENIELSLIQTPEEQEEILTQAAIIVRQAQQLNSAFMTLLSELLLLQHMRLESQQLAQVLQLLELALPPQNQPLSAPTTESFLQQLEFWTRDQREHSQLLRATLPGLTVADREALTRFEREWRALEQASRRLREALTMPGQTPEMVNAEVRRLALMARNLALEFIRFQEDLMGRYRDATSRFILRHMLKETRRLTEELRASGFLIF